MQLKSNLNVVALRFLPKLHPLLTFPEEEELLTFPEEEEDIFH